jgi:hypothetical protein
MRLIELFREFPIQRLDVRFFVSHVFGILNDSMDSIDLIIVPILKCLESVLQIDNEWQTRVDIFNKLYCCINIKTPQNQDLLIEIIRSLNVPNLILAQLEIGGSRELVSILLQCLVHAPASLLGEYRNLSHFHVHVLEMIFFH